LRRVDMSNAEQLKELNNDARKNTSV